MATASLSVSLAAAGIVAIAKANVFLLLVGLFTGYLIFTGRRIAKARDSMIYRADRSIFWITMISSATMLLTGLYSINNSEDMSIPMLLFGLFGMLLAGTDLRRGDHWPEGAERIALHLTRMCGSGVATATAIVVVNIDTNPTYLAWIVPTIVGVPLIAFASNQIKKT